MTSEEYQALTTQAKKKLESGREWKQEKRPIDFAAQAISAAERDGWTFWDVKCLGDDWCLLLWWRYPGE